MLFFVIMKNSLSKKIIFTSLFSAFICAGCFIQIPLGTGVPIVIQDMMAMLSGLILGPLWGSISVLIFLILGCIGLPVFSGKAGIQIILYGPTGGFLIGYLVGALVGGLILYFSCKKERESNAWKWIWTSIAAIAATVVVFILGIIGFHRVLPDKDFNQILAAVLIPFIPGNLIKLAIMIPLSKKIRNLLKVHF